MLILKPHRIVEVKGWLWNVFRVTRHAGSVEISHCSIFSRDPWEVDEVSVTMLASEFEKGLFGLGEKGEAKMEGTSGSLELNAEASGGIRAVFVSADGLKTLVVYTRTQDDSGASQMLSEFPNQ